MHLLFDTHIVLAVVKAGLLGETSEYHEMLDRADEAFVSVATLWEIAIKARLGKLDAGMPPHLLCDYLESVGFRILDINHRHAVTAVEPEPDTRDPFDRMLLAQCRVEGLRLVTFDRALAGHPLAWTAG